jgi:hypothetical protein
MTDAMTRLCRAPMIWVTPLNAFYASRATTKFTNNSLYISLNIY